MTISRRDLLGASVLAATGLALSSPPVAWAAAGPSARQWSELRRSVSGRLLLPRDPSFATQRLIWNSNYDYIQPRALLEAASVADIQQAIAFCRDTGVRPIPRSGGHSFQGFSTGRGLVIDVSALNGIRMSADRSRVRIGAGATLIDIYRRLFDEARMTIVGGTCPLVGIAGLAHGGGIGPFVREYGLTLDRMLGAEIVTADGRRRRIDARHDPDLFWAIRGGGGGNFGIVTSFDLAPVPADMTMETFSLVFPWAAAERVMAAFQVWPDALPRSAYPRLVLDTTPAAPGAQPSISVGLWHRGPSDRARRVIADFIAEVGVAPTSQTTLAQSFFEAEYDANCQGLSAAECAPITQPPGQLPRYGVSTYSEISARPWPRAAITVLLEEMERWQGDPVLQPQGVPTSLQGGKVGIEPISGAVHRTPATATAFPHRDGWLVYQFQARVRPGAPADVVDAGKQWVNGLYARLTPWRTGAEYSNYGNRALTGWAQAYYGENLARLRSVKAQVDPGSLFRFEQGIRPS